MDLGEGHAIDRLGQTWLFDYGARTDMQPVYRAFAVKGTAEGDLLWGIYKYTYESGDDNARLTKVESVRRGSYTLRSTYF